MTKKLTPLDRQRANVFKFANNMYASYLFNKLVEEAVATEKNLAAQKLSDSDRRMKQQMNDLAWQLLLSPEILSTLPCVPEA